MTMHSSSPSPSGAAKAKRGLLFHGWLLAAGIGVAAYAAGPVCADTNEQAAVRSLAQADVSQRAGKTGKKAKKSGKKAKAAKKAKSEKVKQVARIACGGWVNLVAFSPDGTALISQGKNGVQMWDVRSGKSLPDARSDEKLFRYETVTSPDGRIRASVHNGLLQFSDAQTNAPIGEPIRSCVGVRSVAMSPDGKLVAMVRGDDEVVFAAVPASEEAVKRLQDRAAERAKTHVPRFKVETRKLPHDNTRVVPVLIPDATLYAFATEKQIQLHDANTSAPVGEAMLHEAPVEKLAVSPDGKWLASCSGNTVYLWDAHSGKAAGEPLKHDVRVHSIQFSPDGKWLVSRSEKMLYLSDVRSGLSAGASQKHEETNGYKLAFSPDSSVLVTLDDERHVRLRDVRTGKTLGDMQMHKSSSSYDLAVELSPDSKSLVTIDRKGATCLWDTRSGEHLDVGEKVTAIVFSPDGKFVVRAQGKTLCMLDAPSAEPKGEPFEHTENIIGVSFCPNGKLFATLHGNGTVQLWDALTCKPTGKALRHGVQGFPVHMSECAKFSPDGKYLRVAQYPGQDTHVYYLWDIASGKCIGDTSDCHYPQVSTNGAYIMDAATILDANNFFKAKIGKPLNAAMHTSFSADGWTVLMNPMIGYYLHKVTEK